MTDVAPFVAKAAFTRIKILLDVETGVIDAVKPATLAKVWDEVVAVSVLVTDTTCKILPATTPDFIEEVFAILVTVISTP